jgi:thioredoxin-related protein
MKVKIMNKLTMFLYIFLFCLSCTGCPSKTTPPPSEPAPAPVPTETEEEGGGESGVDCSVTMCAPGHACDPVKGCIPVIVWKMFGEEVIKEIDASNNCAMFYFPDEGCPACDYLEDSVFENNAVVEHLNSNFVSVWVLPHPAVWDLFTVEENPSIVLVPPGANTPSVLIEGVPPPGAFLELLRSDRFADCKL